MPVQIALMPGSPSNFRLRNPPNIPTKKADYRFKPKLPTDLPAVWQGFQIFMSSSRYIIQNPSD